MALNVIPLEKNIDLGVVFTMQKEKSLLFTYFVCTTDNLDYNSRLFVSPLDQRCSSSDQPDRHQSTPSGARSTSGSPATTGSGSDHVPNFGKYSNTMPPRRVLVKSKCYCASQNLVLS